MTEEKIKKKINSKNKGAGFESTIAKLFSEKFTPVMFKRTPGSGAYVGGVNARFIGDYSNESRSAFVGDIFAANEEDVFRAEGWRFKFTVECKFYKEADSFTSLFKNPQVKGWFEQALTDARKLSEKEALLIFKFNHTPIFAAVQPHIELPINITATMLLRYNLNNTVQEFIIVPLAELLEHPSWWKQFDPSHIIKESHEPETSKEAT